jgi:hypothetical protein
MISEENDLQVVDVTYLIMLVYAGLCWSTEVKPIKVALRLDWCHRKHRVLPSSRLFCVFFNRLPELRTGVTGPSSSGMF